MGTRPRGSQSEHLVSPRRPRTAYLLPSRTFPAGLPLEICLLTAAAMNCPSRTDDTLDHPDWNQNPPPLSADVTTRQDLNGIANSREQRDHAPMTKGRGDDPFAVEVQQAQDTADAEPVEKPSGGVMLATTGHEPPKSDSKSPRPPLISLVNGFFLRIIHSIAKFARFVGPGFLIAVAYIDPGNYATDVAAGADTRYALLFVVLMSNLFAIFLQSLCIKLGSVTGLNLAENCRAHLPKWLVIILYVFSEAAIIATDIAEVRFVKSKSIQCADHQQVIGSAIALNLLLKIPLVAGCAITLVDVMFILIFYRPNGSMLGLRAFEFFVMALVLGVVVCFCIQLSLIRDQPVGQVFRGYLPSSAVVKGNGFVLLPPSFGRTCRTDIVSSVSTKAAASSGPR